MESSTSIEELPNLNEVNSNNFSPPQNLNYSSNNNVNNNQFKEENLVGTDRAWLSWICVDFGLRTGNKRV